MQPPFGAGPALVRVSSLIADRYDVAAARTGVDARVGRLLVAASRGPLRVAALGHVVRAGKSTMTGILARMIADGLVTRDPDPTDRRASLVTPTARGREVAEALQTEVRGFVLELLQPLGESERARLADLLGAVIERADEILPAE